ncbi:MAG: site-specific integrase [bacterium]|nr:site-specific integrase [bacterium]
MLVDMCRFVVVQDIDEAHALRALAKLTEDGLSVSTRNAFRQACRSVTRWLYREGRLKRDPLAQLDKAKGDSDGGRRALSAGEQRRLVETTRTGPTRGCLTGEARSLMYLLALTTGLRRGELLALRRSDLVLDDDNPVVTVAHGHAKNRKNTRIPLQPEVAAVLRGFLLDALPVSPVFRGAGRHYRAAEVLDHDLEAAGILRETEAGRCDFHSLRTSFVTSLARAGVSVAQAQRLARHCNPSLTTGIYTKFGFDEDAAAIAKLPRLTSEVG